MHYVDVQTSTIISTFLAYGPKNFKVLKDYRSRRIIKCNDLFRAQRPEEMAGPVIMRFCMGDLQGKQFWAIEAIV